MAKAPNPFTALALLNLQQWMFFLVAFFAWSWDAFDFFTVSLTVPELAEQFGKTNTDITWGITLVLMLRSVGAIIFGIAADRYGRKWPFVVVGNGQNLALDYANYLIRVLTTSLPYMFVFVQKP